MTMMDSIPRSLESTSQDTAPTREVICAGLKAEPAEGHPPRDVQNSDGKKGWTHCWTEKACPAEMKGGCVWEGKGLVCGMERDTQRQTHEWLPPDSTVLEVGSRFGTVSCTISTVQKNSGKRLSIEPDALAFLDLERNIERNMCRGIQVNGVVSHENAKLPGGGSYGTGAISSKKGEIRGYTPNDLEKILSNRVGQPLKFDTLYIDCEGCAFKFISEWPELMRQVKMVFLEADGGGYMKFLREFVPLMCAYGFDVVEDEINHTCCPGLHHVVFERTGPCAAQVHQCAVSPKRWVVPRPSEEAARTKAEEEARRKAAADARRQKIAAAGEARRRAQRP